MRIFFTSIYLLCSRFAAGCPASAFFGGTSVSDLCSSNFPPNRGAWLVAFYTQGCGCCKRLRPDFIRVAAEMAATCREVRLGAIDCNQDAHICQQFPLTGYPTLKVFLNGQEVMDYSGMQRDAKSIGNFIREQVAAAGMKCSPGSSRKMQEYRSQYASEMRKDKNSKKWYNRVLDQFG